MNEPSDPPILTVKKCKPLDTQDTTVQASKFIHYVRDLEGHDKTVNCIRYNNTGQYFASSSDGTQNFH